MLDAGQVLVPQNLKWNKRKKNQLVLKSQFVDGERTLMSFLDAIKHSQHFVN
jgi:hypothetical protein